MKPKMQEHTRLRLESMPSWTGHLGDAGQPGSAAATFFWKSVPQSFVYAPVTAGQEAGTAHVLLEGVPVGKVPVVWGETIAAPTEPEEPNWLERIWGGKG